MRDIEVATILLKSLPRLMRFRSCTFLPIGEFRDGLSVGLFKNFKNAITHPTGLQLDLLQSARERSGRLKLQILQSVRKRSGGFIARNPMGRKKPLWRCFRQKSYRAFSYALEELPLEILQSVGERSGGITARNPIERKRTLWRDYR